MYRFALFGLFSAFVLFLSGYRSAQPVDQYGTLLAADLTELQKSVRALPHSIRQMEHADAFGAFEAAKLAFKRVEALAWYLDPEFVGTFINGAPLPKLQHGVPSIEVIEPHGFQILEEALYAETPDQANCLELANDLVRHTDELIVRLKGHSFNDHQLFEASKLELIRIISLGITGFDAPARDMSLYESARALERVRAYLKPYEPNGPLDGYLAEAVKGLDQGHNAGFQSFDRARWLRNYALPAHRELVRLQAKRGIEFHHEVDKSLTPVRWNEEELFSERFFNPFYFTKMPENAWNAAKAELGKRLFYEAKLSEREDMSCGTCHQPEKGFTDGLAISGPTGEGQVSRGRNTQTLINAVYSPTYFWDLRVEKLENQLLHVFFNKNEFNVRFESIYSRLAADSTYVRDFKNAFGAIDFKYFKHQIEEALTSYLITLHDFNSPVDQWLRGERAQLPEEVLRGFNLFMGEASCGTCHFAPTFSGLVPPYFNEMESEVLGVMTAPRSKVLDPDLGRYAGPQTQRAAFYKNSFKTVTVRNARKTAPFMHNGAYPDLESVVDFYHHGGGAGLGIDLPHQTLPSDSLNLSPSQRKDLVAFMKALSGR